MIDKEKFSWIPFYTNFADKLLLFKNDRKSLIDLIKKVYSDISMKLPKLDNGEIIDIDPFTVYGLFNKGLTDINRIKIIDAFKKELGINETTPTDFDGIPVLNNMHATFYYFAGDRKEKDIDNLWALFEFAINYSKSSDISGREKFIELFNTVREQQGVAWNITMGLFWVRPYDYINLDSCSRTAFNECRMIPPIDYGVRSMIKDVVNGEEYFKIIDLCKECFKTHKDLSFPELSHRAWKNKGGSDGWWPSLSEYNPNISTDKWLDFLSKDVKKYPSTLKMLATMLELGGEATCKKLSEVLGGHHSTYIGRATGLGERVKKEYGLPPCMDGDKERFFPVAFLGKPVEGSQLYTWKLRPELRKALEEMDLSSLEESSMQTDINKNTILYGPPGTGKTYITARYAVAIIENKPFEALADIPYEDIIKKYNEYKAQGRIEFTTFHQSYGYEEFIEGIKPVFEVSEEDNNDIKYEVASGIFKRFCDSAGQPIVKSKNIEVGLNKNPTVWKVSLWSTGDNPIRTECMENNHIRIGWDSYGPDITSETDFSTCGGKNVLNSFIYKMKVGDIVMSCYSSTTVDAIGVVTGDYEWNGEFDDLKRVRNVNWLVKGINENIVDMNNGSVMTLASVYKMNISASDALSIVEKYSGFEDKYETEKQNYVFIIDEINRGNISKIFGELITLIEPTKRLGQSEAIKVKLPYSQKLFGVPDNVYIIGTMNTADRSIAAIDTALRRRFAFKEMMPDTEILEGLYVDGVSIPKLLELINERVEVLYDREHTIGHAYFTSLINDNKSEVLFDIFRNKIFPLLQEYFYEDYEKIRLVLGDNQKSDVNLQFITEETVDYGRLFGSNVYDYDDKKVYTINEDAFKNIEAYKEILKGRS